MRYRFLGKTGFKISEIGFGAWAIGGSSWGAQDDYDSRQALHQSLDMGCNFIDTAAVYGDGHSEQLIGSVIRERHEHPVIATKIPPKNWNWDNPSGTPLTDVFPSDWIISKTEESLKNLGVDCVEIQQLHTWNKEWNSQADGLLSTMDRLKREGKIRAFGISLRDKGADEANDLIRFRQVDCLQIFFNLLYQEPIQKLFPLAKQYGTGIVARVPMAFGALTGRFNAKTTFPQDDHRSRLYVGDDLKITLVKVEKLKFLASRHMPLAEAAIKWTLAYPEVSTSIPGLRNLRQAQVNCAAGDGPSIPADLVKKAEKIYHVNFGLPVKKVESNLEVHAVLMSGVKVSAKKPKAVKAQKKTKVSKKKKKTGKKAKAQPKKIKKHGKRK
jgi:aryl-alcohol dehydrogenase-like predicted oxidoreductase